MIAFWLCFLYINHCWSSDREVFESQIKQFSQKDVPGYVTDTPLETNLNDHTLLDAEAQKGFTKNEAATVLRDSANTRPYFVLDPLDDPIALNSKEALADPQTFIIKQSYQNCSVSQYVTKTCTESKPDRKYTCSRKLNDPKVTIYPTYTIPQGLSNFYRCGGKSKHADNDPDCGTRIYYPLPPLQIPEKVAVAPDTWSSTCQNLEEKSKRGMCKIVKQICVDNSTHHIPAPVGNTGVIRSHPITKDCWHYTYEYECTYPECTSLRQSHCEQMESKCILKEGEKCIAWEQTFRCPTNQCSTQKILQTQGQGNQILEGHEYLKFEPNAEMNEAITKLHLLKEVQNDLRSNAAENNKKENIPHVFKGDKGACTIAFAGFSDCCGYGKGWGCDMHLSNCSGDEKILAQKREKGLCYELGKYCAERHLGKCIRKKKSFCCFPSKFALVLHKQGRKQVGMDWDAPEKEQCRGFTIDELSRLNFDELDLSEFYNELISKMKHPNTSVVQRNLQDRVGQISSSLKNEQRKGGY